MTKSNTHKSRIKGPIRILRIIARLNIGGPAIQAITLSDHLSDSSYRTLLVTGKVSPHEGDMSFLAREKGVRPVVLTDLGRQISPLEDLNSLMRIRKIIRTFRPHIIHTHTAKAGTLGRLAALSLLSTRRTEKGIRLVHTFHGHVFHSYFGPLKTGIIIRIERVLARFTDRLIVISPRQQQDICQRFKIARPEKVKVIPLGLDLSKFADLKMVKRNIRDEYVPHEPKRILLVGIIGRLTSVKNHRMFLEAVKCLKDKGEDKHFRFLVVGDGELREALMTYVSELGIQESVVFAGWHKDMAAIYGALDIVVLTSLNEGTPVTLIEAMASGIPVVATDVGGVRDLFGRIENSNIEGYKMAQNGILIPSGDAEFLAKALLHIRENRVGSKKKGERAKAFVVRKYSVDRLIKDIKSLYRELITVD